MKLYLTIPALFSITIGLAQTKQVAGTYIYKEPGFCETKITFKEDSTFEFYSQIHPTFGILSDCYQYGTWTILGKYIILNPQLTPTPAYQSDFLEEEIPGDTGLTLTFNDVTRYFDVEENLVKSDTERFFNLEFAFNKWNRKTITHVSDNVDRIFLNNISTKERTIVVPRPAEGLTSYFIDSYALMKIEEFIIRNPKSNHLTYSVFANHRAQELRQKKILIRNDHTLFGIHLINSYASPYLKLKRVKVP